jgi:hypothetical protein
MASRTEFEEELGQANRHIVEARGRMARQWEAMRTLEAAGDDATQAKKLFRAIEEGLEAMLVRHRHLVRELAKAPGEEAELAKVAAPDAGAAEGSGCRGYTHRSPFRNRREYGARSKVVNRHISGTLR